MASKGQLTHVVRSRVAKSAMYDIPFCQVGFQGRRETQLLRDRGEGLWSSWSYGRRRRNRHLGAVNGGSLQQKVIQAITNYEINKISIGGSDMTMMHVKTNFEVMFQ